MRNTLLKAVLADLYKYETDDSDKYTNCQNELNTPIEQLEIETGSRTGKPNVMISLADINLEQRFATRVTAFNLLSKYWRGNGKETILEKPQRSTSPLRNIFEYQEEYVFDIPIQQFTSNQVGGSENTRKEPTHIRDIINIEVSKFENEDAYGLCFNKNKSKKKMHKKKRSMYASRKNSSYDQKQVITGLSSILSELESDNPSLSSSKQIMDSLVCDNFTSAVRIQSRKTTATSLKSSSKIRKKTNKSSKIVCENNSFLKPQASRKARTKKSRPASISYSQQKMLGLIKSLDEISTELESGDATR